MHFLRVINLWIKRYLGRCTYRIVISNARIKEVKNRVVTFEYKDYKDHDKMKLMKISVEEFIRRFMLYILPYKFVKIRYYGILANKEKRKKIKLCKKLTNTKEVIVELSKIEILEKAFEKAFNICKCCGRGKMILVNSTWKIGIYIE